MLTLINTIPFTSSEPCLDVDWVLVRLYQLSVTARLESHNVSMCVFFTVPILPQDAIF